MKAASFDPVPENDSDEEARKLRSAIDRITATLNELRAVLPSRHDKANATNGPVASDILKRARNELRFRASRSQLLPNWLFGEPGWVILIDLFTRQMTGKTTSVSSACIASGAPATTALRAIQRLEEDGLICRTRSEADARLRYIQLTPAGLSCVVQALQQRAD